MGVRRQLFGKPLLVATVGVAMTAISGCAGRLGDSMVSGNLVPPPMVSGEICVDVTPPGATVVIDGAPTTARCTTVVGPDRVQVEARGPNGEYHSQTVILNGTVELQIVLPPLSIAPVVGNLMPPQPPVKPQTSSD